MCFKAQFCMLLALGFAGCVTFQPVKLGALSGEQFPISQTFSAPLDQTWEAVVDVMQRYPITTIEKASGLLITDWVDGTSDVYYADVAGEREMLKDRTKFNIKVSQTTDGSRVTVNQYVKVFAPSVVVVDPMMGGPVPQAYEWRDVSGIKDLPTRTSSKREREILEAVETRLKVGA